jgi:hypothetical protein
MTMKKSYLAMAMMGAMMSDMMTFPTESKGREYVPIEPRKKIVPKGCEEYHFTRSGHFDTTDNTWNDIDYIFSCVASNSKSAIKKFNAFIRSNEAER